MNRDEPSSNQHSAKDNGADTVTDRSDSKAAAADSLGMARSDTTAKVKASIKKRYARERRFRLYGLIAIVSSLSFLAILIFTITKNGLPAFQQTFIQLDVTLDSKTLGLGEEPDEAQLLKANYNGAIKKALLKSFPDVKKRKDKKALYKLISKGGQYKLQSQVMASPDLIGQTRTVWLPAGDDASGYLKGIVDVSIPEKKRRLKDNQIEWIESLKADNRIEQRFNSTFFERGDSREPEMAGIKGALFGSILTLMVTLLLSFPIAVASAIYLEEFAPRNKWTDLIEVNINNLAAVPSIVFGLLGLAVFINFFHLPRSAPVVGGLVLSLMTLPTIIISSRAALKSVPPSIRDAALGLGASRLQVVFHHVLPLALPGILTGTIIGMAQALGETAPLLMIGMVAFIVDIPAGITDPATVLPVQIFQWADLPEKGFVEKTSAAIMVLLGLLVAMNTIAVLLRRKFERKW
jgi:phosphate transport system permease protein